MAELSQEAVAQEEQTQQSTQVATDPEAGMTTEEKLLKRSNEIKQVLDNIQKEEIDPSLYTDILESFTDEKKEELQAIVDEVNNPLGSKTITMRTFAERSRLVDGGGFFQEVYMKDGAITKYGDVYLGSYATGDIGGYGAFGFKRQPLPQDVEFDLIAVCGVSFYARPKAGQSNVGGVSGSLDNYLYVWGKNSVGQLGTADTTDRIYGDWVRLNSRVKDISATGVASTSWQTLCILLLENREIYSAGYNTHGELGLGNTINTSSFTKVMDGVNQVFSNGVSVFVATDAEIYAFGFGTQGQLGTGATSHQSTPKSVLRITDPSSLKFAIGDFYNGVDTSYGLSLISADGILYGSGRNSNKQIEPSSTTTKTTFVEAKTSGNETLKIGENDTFYTNGDECYLLKENNGNFDFYHSGYAYSGAGSTSTGINQSLTKMKTFDGLGWKILGSCLRSESSVNHNLCIYNEKTREIYVLGANQNGQLGVGGTSAVYTLTKLTLPHNVLSADNFEIRLSMWGAYFGILIIADGELYMSGATTSGRKRVASSTFQREDTNI